MHQTFPSSLTHLINRRIADSGQTFAASIHPLTHFSLDYDCSTMPPSSSSSSTTPLGISVSLPTGTASDYQRRRQVEIERRRRAGEQDATASTNTEDDRQHHVIVSHSEDEGKEDELGGEEHGDDGPRPIGIDLDKEIIPFQAADSKHRDDESSSNFNDTTDDEHVSDDDDDNSHANKRQIEQRLQAEEDQEQDDDDVSQSPPASMPLLKIDLPGLTGCTPKNEMEKNILVAQVRLALLGLPNTAGNEAEENDQEKDDETGPKDEPKDDEVDTTTKQPNEQWLDFAKNSAEIFDMEAASHCDTSTAKEDLLSTLVEYPEFVVIPSSASNTTSDVVATARVWKILTASHRIPVVDRILGHLATTSRDIVWRYQMNTELRNVARTEEYERKRRERSAELEEWTSGRRKLELERLYQVRETFEYRLNAAKRNMDEVVERREERVRAELARRREAGVSGGGVDGLDWAKGAATFVFGDETADAATPAVASALTKMRSPYSSDDQSDPYSSDDRSGYELDVDDGDDSADDERSDHSDEEGDNAHPDNLPQSKSNATAERRRLRANKSAKRMRKRLARQEEEGKRRSQIEAAKSEERSIRQMCTLPEEKLAKAVVDQLEERMAKVDDLLEQIQEEEWAEEEGEDGVSGAVGNANEAIGNLYDDLDEERQDRPLLDQILAMIFSAARPSEGQTKKQHFQFIRNEHQDIVSDWWNHFGRLPPSSSEREENVNAHGLAEEIDQQVNTSADEMLVAGALTALQFQSKDDEVSQKYHFGKAKSSASQTPEAMRSMLGIADNADDDWDEVADWGDFGFGADNAGGEGDAPVMIESSTKSKVKEQPKRPGLRPGGRIK